MGKLLGRCGAAAVTLFALPMLGSGPACAEGYRSPPADIADIVLRAPSPRVSVSPDGKTLLLLLREGLPPVAELAKPMERLAGLRLDAATNDRHGPRTIVGLTVKDLATGKERPVALPADADIDGLSWSPDGKAVAFTLTGPEGVGLWVLDVAGARAAPVIAKGLNPIFQAGTWLPNGQLLALVVPENRPARPVRALTPSGPAISVAAGGEKAQIRTFQDLLSDPHDERMFEWLALSQPVIVDVSGKNLRKLGPAALYRAINPAPDGVHLLVEWMQRPFSYQVPFSDFPLISEVWTMQGAVAARVAELPLRDNLPIQGVPVGRRALTWHPTLPATLLWAEALDGGDPKRKAAHRDAVFAQAAPFKDAPRQIARLEDRFAGLGGLENSDDLLIADYDRDTREIRRQLVDVIGGAAPRVVEKRSIQDDYADPGQPLTTLTAAGKSVARVRNGKLFLSGEGESAAGARPFLRSLDLTSLQTRELWRNSGENYETVVDLAAPDASAFVTYYEDRTNPGNFRLHGKRGAPRFLTALPDPHPELTGIRRELITYTRKDGVQLSATLYLPPSYKEGQKLPVVVWAYPYEYNDAATAGQVRGSKHRFTRIGSYSHLFFLLRGYAIMDDAAMPVVGPNPDTVNELFIPQIVASAQAAVDETVRRGFGDGKRVGVGGHSYGAFMTAHLLAHSDIFKAGIARSGAYNRTLTPFGFQSERRSFWEAPESYYRLSPFMAADKINEPLLMIHGQADNNPGTFPEQSERMYAAVRGTGGTAKLVLLPHESHGYRGRESILHTLAEMVDWFDVHVKGEQPPG